MYSTVTLPTLFRATSDTWGWDVVHGPLNASVTGDGSRDDVTSVTSAAAVGAASVSPLSTPLYISVMVTLLYGVILTLGVAGNGLCVFVICRQRDMKTPTNLFLMNLSVADMLVLLVCVPSSLMQFYTQDVWHLGDAMCEYYRTKKR